MYFTPIIGLKSNDWGVLYIKTLEKVINITNDYPYRRTFHSDQGLSYQMNIYIITTTK